MEMPTPCPTCTRIVELNDMNNCRNCRELFCNKCLGSPWEYCDVCVDEENIIEDE
jgi:hypothetical protein